ncbi:MAG: NAD(P)-binding domain-containing protein [Acidobacteria bacterium]|nr:NAD(P)-binding domain-containing protein [Acidobacteriota bacterium]
MEASKLRVCVVGAGVSGLTALKEVLEEGHSAVCFERENVPGGVFTTGVAYDPMQLTVSQYFMAYSSFPPPLEEERRHWRRQEYAGYLGRFRQRFGLDPHIRLNCAVETVSREADGSFAVETTQAGKRVRDRFDAVAICRGAFRAEAPRMPDLPGAETFKGEITHTAEYKGAEPFRGKRVVCLGMGETSADVTSQISEVALACHLALRSYPLLISRFPYGGSATNDGYTTRLLGWAPRQQIQEYYGQRVQADLESGDAQRQLISEWFIKAGFTGKSLQKNDDFVANLLNGKIRHVPHGVARLEGNTVHFANGEHVEADVVMCCTGYEESSIPAEWLGGLEVKDVRGLFKHAFHPDIGPRLALIGWTRPFNGGVPACSEMISRYFALLCSGKRELPARPDMEQRIAEDLAHEELAFAQSRHIRTLVDFNTFLDGVAELVGCAPKLTDYLDDPPLLYKLICGSSIAATYRLRGPGADREMARKVILRLPVVRDAVDLALVPLALAGRVEESAIPKIHEIVEQQFASDTQLA